MTFNLNGRGMALKILHILHCPGVSLGTNELQQWSYRCRYHVKLQQNATVHCVFQGEGTFEEITSLNWCIHHLFITLIQSLQKNHVGTNNSL